MNKKTSLCNFVILCESLRNSYCIKRIKEVKKGKNII